MNERACRIGLLGLCLSLCSWAYCQEPAPSSTPVVAYAADYVATVETRGSSKAEVAYREARLVSSSGNRRTITQHEGGPDVEQFAIVGQGLLLVDQKQHKLLRVASAGQIKGPKPSGKFLRSERVLQFDTLVYETPLPDGSVLAYHAPALNGDILKLVRRNPRNTFAIEAQRVLLGEPNAEAMRPPDYPVVEATLEDLKNWVKRQR